MGGTDGTDEWDLAETERAVLALLAAGRETRGSCARALDVTPTHVGRTLRTLRALNLVEYRDEPTGLYQITARGFEALDDASEE